MYIIECYELAIVSRSGNFRATQRPVIALDEDIALGKQTAGASAEPIYAVAMDMVARWPLAPEACVIDVGGGRGNFARKLLAHFQHVEIVDHETHAVPEPLRYRVSDLNALWDLADAHYDAACALEVIEHVENPRHFTRELYRILKPGGRCILTTPNQLSLSSKLSLVARDYFRDFSDNCYPAHITALVKKDLERIMAEAGFVITGFRFTGVGRIPFARYTWQQVMPWFRGQWFSDNIAVGGYKKG